MSIHPKTSGAAVGGALGVLIVAILHSIPSVHLAPEAFGAIPSFLSLLGAWIVPGSDGTVKTVVYRPEVPPQLPAPAGPGGPTAPVP